MKTSSIPDGWERVPLTPMPRAQILSGGSMSRLYALIHAGKLKAVRVAGKTMIVTESLTALQAEATPWVSDRNRVIKAIEGRHDVIAKRARLAAEMEEQLQRRRVKERARKATEHSKATRKAPAHAARASPRSP